MSIETMKAKVEEAKANLPEIILKDPELFKRITITEFDKKIVNELETRQTIFLCCCGMFVENHNTASYNLMINDEAGAGKDYVATAVTEIFPKERAIKRTRITPHVLTYWHNPKFEPDWTWSGKTLYLEDIGFAIVESDVFKVMSSSGSHATVLINQFPVDIEIKGKPVILVTTASAAPGAELMRRFPIVNLDSGIIQTQEIMKRHAIYAKDGHSMEYNEAITKALDELKIVPVIVPYAEKIAPLFPSHHMIVRTHFVRFIDYIKASCALHQFQREKNDEGFYIATSQDYDIARIAINKTTSNQFMIPLTRNHRRIMDIFKNKFGDSEFVTFHDVEGQVSFLQDRQLRRELDKLVEFGLLRKEAQQRNEGRKDVMCYQLVKLVQLDLPVFTDIDSSTTKWCEAIVLQDMYNRPSSETVQSDKDDHHAYKTIKTSTLTSIISPPLPCSRKKERVTNDSIGVVGSVSKEGESLNVGDKIP